MAPPKKANPPVIGGEVEQEADDALFVPQDAEFDNAVAELDTAGGGSISVYREGPGGYRNPIFVKSFALSAFDKEMLQRPPFNGGRFRLHLKSAAGVFVRNIAFECEPDHAAIEAQKAASAPPAAPVMDAAAILREMRTEMRELLAAQAAQPRQGMGVEDTLRLIAAVQGMAAPRAAGPEADPFTLLERLVKLRDSVMPPPVNADGEVSTGALLLRSVETFGKPLMELAMQNRNGPGAQSVQQVQQLAPPALPVQQNPIPQQPEESEMNIKMKLLGPVILLAARSNADPATYANMVLDYFDDAQIAQYIQAPDWFAQLCVLMPDLRPHEAWATEVRAVVLELLTPEPDSGTTGADNPGQPSNAAG